VLAADGSVLAACVNAATLALVDAGVPMPEYLVACTAGSAGGAGRGGTGGSAGGEGDADPLMDLNAVEEGELPFLTVATIGAGERVCVLVMETRVPAARLEGMLAVGVDGCKQVREILDGVVRRHGKKVLAGAAG
jgi:exosome complex component RRP41